jgi:hypothetical protein
MSFSDFVFTSLKKKLPTINWNLGSMVRELIVTPLVTVADLLSDKLTEQINATSIQNMLKYPETYEDKINSVFTSLGLTAGDTVKARGTVTIHTNSKEPTAIPSGTVFYYNDTAITTSDTVKPSFIPTVDPYYTPLRQIANNSYVFDVPVEVNYLSTTLTAGTPVSWNEAPEDVYNIVISSPLSGGKINITLQEKVDMIRDYIAPNVITLNDGINKTLRAALTDYVVNASFAKDITATNKSYLYVKTLKVPGNYYKTVTCARQENGTYSVEFDEIGVLDVLAIYHDNKPVTISKKEVSTNRVNCTIVCDSEQALINVDVQLYGMSDLKIVQDYLDGYTLGTPITIEVIPPDVYTLELEFTYTGRVLSTAAISTIVDEIQSKPMNPVINDNTLENILVKNGANLVGSCTYAVTKPDGSCFKQQNAPGVFVTNKERYSLYTGLDKIKAKHV